MQVSHRMHPSPMSAGLRPHPIGVLRSREAEKLGKWMQLHRTNAKVVPSPVHLTQVWATPRELGHPVVHSHHRHCSSLLDCREARVLHSLVIAFRAILESCSNHRFPAPKPCCTESKLAKQRTNVLFELGHFGFFCFFFAGHRFVDGGRKTIQLTPYFKA